MRRKIREEKFSKRPKRLYMAKQKSRAKGRVRRRESEGGRKRRRILRKRKTERRPKRMLSPFTVAMETPKRRKAP